MKKIALIALLILSACGSKDSTSPDPAKATSQSTDQKIVESLTYEFSQKLSTGETCSTGTHHLQNRHELCMRIQDEELNHGCAFHERINFFMNGCKGYQFLSGLQCRFGILKPDAKKISETQLPVKIEYTPDQFVQPIDLCVGRDTGPADELQLELFLNSNYSEDISMALHSAYTREGKSTFTLQLSADSGESISVEYHAGAGGIKFGSSEGTLINKNGQKRPFYVGCEVTVGCPRSK